MMHSVQKIKEGSSPYLDPNPPSTQIEWKQPISSGMHGPVVEVVVKQTFALKQIELAKMCDSIDEEDLENALFEVHEAFLMMKKNLRNVARTYQYFYDEKRKKYLFTMEIFENNLCKYAYENSLLEKDFIPIFENIVEGKKKIYGFKTFSI